MYRFLVWMTRELPAYLRERKRSERWKYLVEWLPLVRRATFHHSLLRPGSQETDYFDLVTAGDQGKVLHLLLVREEQERFVPVLPDVISEQ